VQVIGHRGAAALAPENTWSGFDLAIEIGVDAIETDVQATSDGVLVLLHDERLDRTTDGSGLLRETPWSVVRELDAGAWFDERYRGARVPQLAPTLDRYGGHTHLAIEIKQLGVELEALAQVRERGLLPAVTFTSFHWEAVRRIREAAPQARVGYLTADVSADVVRRVVDAGLTQLCPVATSLSPERVAAWKALGLEVRAWGVRTPELMRFAITTGVDGMTVDFPDLLLKELGRKAT